MNIVIPFVVEGWHAPAGRTDWEPRPLAQARQTSTAPPVGATKLGPRPTDHQRRHQPVSRSGRDPGHRPYAATTRKHRKQGRKPTIHILPVVPELSPRRNDRSLRADQVDIPRE